MTIKSEPFVVNVGPRTMGCTVDAVTQVMRIPEGVQVGTGMAEPERRVSPARRRTTAPAGYHSRWR